MARWGEVNEGQRKLEESQTTAELAQKATEGIQNTFVLAGGQTLIYRGGTEEAKRDTSHVAPGNTQENNAISESDILKDIVELKGMSISHGNALAEIARVVSHAFNRDTEDIQSGKIINTISTLIETGMQSSISSATEMTSACKSHMEVNLAAIQKRLEESSQAMIMTCEERLSEINLTRLEELVARQEKAAERALSAADEMKVRQQEMIKLFEDHRTYLFDLLTRMETEVTDDQHCDEGVSFAQENDGQSESEENKYAAEARQRANGILSLLDTMPYRRKAPPDSLAPHDDSAAAFPKMVTTEICMACNKQDLGLLYCDTCEDIGGLYHAECLTLLDTAKRSCPVCVQNSKAALTSTGDKTTGNPTLTGGLRSAQGQSGSDNNKSTFTDNIQNTTSDVLAPSSSEESSSSSTSMASTSSASSIAPYTQGQWEH